LRQKGQKKMDETRRFPIAAAVRFVLLFSAVHVAFGQGAPIQILADLTDAPRRLYHAEIDLPVRAGPLALTTAEWIPGHHRPSGPVSEVTGVVFTAGGKTLDWRRDDVDMYEYHVTIPPGVTTLHAHLDCIVTGGISQKLAMLEWEKLLLYPAGVPVREIPIQPSVKVPPGWGIGTALTPLEEGSYPFPPAGSTTRFAVTNVEQLEDSPVITGQYFHEFALAPSISPKHYIDVASDYPEDSNLKPQVLDELSNLVREADALYRSHHYNSYHFLLTLSDVAGYQGIEHGQSSDNGMGEKGFANDAQEVSTAPMLPHEFTHSWNGKYRRPEGLYQPDFATPQKGALLWVYEGMTEYLSYVLAARSGLLTPEQFKDSIADIAAQMDNQPGRDWRSTEDTAVAASILRDQNPAWSNWRRGQDYYREGGLLWLDVDTLIRKRTDNKKSLDDFLRIFLGKGGNTGPLIVPYGFDELVQDLNAVAPYDWAAFLHDKVDKIHPHADMEGIERGGYKLVYREKPNATDAMRESTPRGRMHSLEYWYSIGLNVRNDGTINDVRWGGPADKGQLAPGEKIIAVDGRIYSQDALKEAIRNAKETTDPIHLIVQADSYVQTAQIDYHGGERFPVLERLQGTPDLLDVITTPLIKPEAGGGAGKNKADP
jgi:predicted metalloprotease with PDZ domain